MWPQLADNALARDVHSMPLIVAVVLTVGELVMGPKKSNSEASERTTGS